LISGFFAVSFLSCLIAGYEHQASGFTAAHWPQPGESAQLVPGDQRPRKFLPMFPLHLCFGAEFAQFFWC